MMLQHDALPRSVGWIRATPAGANTVHGSGFLVAPTRVITCAHCLRGEQGQIARSGTIQFTQARDDAEIPFEVLFEQLTPEAGVDVAVLEIERAVEGTACLSLSSAQPQGKNWRSFGHPRAIDSHPLWLSGQVEGPIARRSEALDGWLLSLLVKGESAPIAGMSGAPLLTDDGVIGVLSYQLYMRESAAGQAGPVPAFSKAFAVPSKLLLELPDLLASLQRAAKVFIAYRRGDAEEALMRSLHSALEDEGHEPFSDLDMRVGQDWARQLQRRLDEADCCVPILTERSIESPMLLQELRLAYRRWRQTGRPLILPIRHTSLTTLPYELQMYVGDLQYAPWSGPDSTADTIRAICAAVAHRDLDTPAPPSSQPASQTRGYIPLRSTSSALPLNDSFYIERPSDRRAYERLNTERFIMTIMSPSGFGASSLVARVQQRCKDMDRKVAHIDFQRFGRLPSTGRREGYVTFLNDFADMLCQELEQPLPSEPLDNHIRIQAMLMNALAQKPNTVLILDGMDRLITRSYATDFFATCRAWVNKTSLTCSFVFCIAIKPEVLIQNLDQSPFNIDANPIELRAFDENAFAELAQRAGFRLEDNELSLLYQVTGGHPALARQALSYVLAPSDADPQRAPRRDEVSSRIEYVYNECGVVDGGPFSSHLRALLSRLASVPPIPGADESNLNLVEVMRKIVAGRTLQRAELASAKMLRALGVVQRTAKLGWREKLGLVDALERLGLKRAAGDRESFEPLNLAYAQFFRDQQLFGALP